MRNDIIASLAVGAERVAAWADILDRINVFPVPDGDTGRNLTISLQPLRNEYARAEELTKALLLSARGNSGNIAASFLTEFIHIIDLEDLPQRCIKGRDKAYKAVPEPKPGTILTVLDTLVDLLQSHPVAEDHVWVDKYVMELLNIVKSSTEKLPELQQASVVDSGALGMFILFDACFKTMVGRENDFISIAESFKGALELSDSWRQSPERGYCLDVVLHTHSDARNALGQIEMAGESIVVVPEGNYLKLHIHTDSLDEVRHELEGIGEILRWSEDDLFEQTQNFLSSMPATDYSVMTDGAGSISRSEAEELGILLLDSYVTLGAQMFPETRLDPNNLYREMRQGVKVSTSQASVFERCQHYEKALNLFPNVLYLCVGSAYTGNYEAAKNWKEKYDTENRFRIIDSGTASGQLGLVARLAAHYALKANNMDELEAFVRGALNNCTEYIFLDRLHYLANGGRMSKTGAFLGDLFNVKPIVSPFSDGARKVGVVRNQLDQVQYALDRMAERISVNDKATILIEYSDNKEWVLDKVKGAIADQYPTAEIIDTPLSLTAACHMGPGTWAVAFCTEENHPFKLY